MHHRISWRRAAAIAALVVSPTVFATYRSGLDKLLPPDGMTRAKVKGFGLAYVQPHGSLGAYDKVLLDPVSVAYRRDWDPERTGSRIQISDEQREALRTAVAGSVHDAFAKALQQGGRYRIVDQAGPGVLHVRLKVVDLYLNFAGAPTAGRSRTYSASTGEISMVAELSDAGSGQVLARVADWEDMRNTGVALPSGSTRTSSDIEGVAAGWGRSLRDAMRAARPREP
jgi:hypothetical protein